MRYRLGSYLPMPGSSDFARWLYDKDQSLETTTALEDMLQLRLSRSVPAMAIGEPDTTPTWTDAESFLAQVRQTRAKVLMESLQTLPDLLDALVPPNPDRAWVSAVHDRFEALPVQIRLLACEYEEGPEGFLTLAGTSPDVCGSVREGDRTYAGFVAMRDGGGVRMWPRIFREVCKNGSLVCTSEGEDLLAQGLGVPAALDSCFDRQRFEQAIECLREAARRHLPDPRPMLDEMGYIRHHRAPILSRYRVGQDATVYGLFNAMTSVARDLPDPRERLRLEETAGRLAWLMRPAGRKIGVITRELIEA